MASVTCLPGVIVCLILGTSVIATALSNVQDSSNGNGSNGEIMSRILYGSPVDIRNYPSFVFLGDCGGTILSDSWALTAAHCVEMHVQSVFYKPRPLWVAGKHDPGNYQYTYNRVIIHPKYTNSVQHDIALLGLTRKLKFSSEVQPARLPNGRNFVGGRMVLVARGADETGNLSDGVKSVELKSYDCTERRKEQTFCAKRQNSKPGTCKGDSGSPLFRGNFLVGVVVAIDREPCISSTMSFYVSIAHERQWIKSITRL